MRGWKDIQEEQSTMHLLLISIEFHVHVILCTLASTIDCNNHIQTGPQAICVYAALACIIVHVKYSKISIKSILTN